MSLRVKVAILTVSFLVPASHGDELLYRYEGDVVPYDESAGWIIADACDPPCRESLQDGHFVLDWPFAENQTNYHLWIARAPEEPPETLWVEWGFRSNHPIGPNFSSCDAHFTVDYREVHDTLWIYGDAVISFSGDDFVGGLDMNQFHTYRFESLDGVNFWFSVDGLVFSSGAQMQGNSVHFLQTGGRGGCASDQIPDMVNEWDMVRYGTISFGEKIVGTDPPGGYLDPDEYPALDRFAITFDSPNYVYVNQITVEVSGGETPVVIRTWRRENDAPETLQIVLDRPIPLGEETRFIINDGIATNVVEYTYIRPVPTQSIWALVALVLILLSAATITLPRRTTARALPTPRRTIDKLEGRPARRPCPRSSKPCGVTMSTRPLSSILTLSCSKMSPPEWTLPPPPRERRRFSTQACNPIGCTSWIGDTRTSPCFRRSWTGGAVRLSRSGSHGF